MKTPIKMTRAYEEIIDFLAAGTTPKSLIEFQSSEDVKERVAGLIFREKNSTLTSEEKSELDHYMLLEHLIRLAKARAHQYIIKGSFYQTATPEEWIKALREWSESHHRNLPLVSDEAVSRRGMYEED